MVSENDIVMKLGNAGTNWIAELLCIKTALKCIFTDNFNLSETKYVNRNINSMFYIDSVCYKLDTDDIKPKIFYAALVKKKYVKNYMEKYWSNFFGIECTVLKWELV